MADISKIKLPSGSVYDIKDAWSREKIGDISSMIQGGVHYLGKTTTELSGDGDTTSAVVIGGETVTASQGDMVSMAKAGSQDLEFIFNGTAWYELGSTGSLKALAFKDSASGSTSYTPEGELTGLAFSGNSFQSTGAYQPEGTIALTGSTDLATTVSQAESGDPTYTPAGNISAAFTGSEFQSTGSYQPAGTVAAPAISLSSAGATDTVHNPTAVTVVKELSTYSSATAPANAVPYWDIVPGEECLVLNGIMQNTGDSINTTDLTVKTGDATYSASAPEFTGTATTLSVAGTATGSITDTKFWGTGARLETGSITVPSGADFTGTSTTLSVEGTATGSITGAKFWGTGARLETGSITVPSGADFTGTSTTLSVEGTATGSVSGGFSGTTATISITAS